MYIYGILEISLEVCSEAWFYCGLGGTCWRVPWIVCKNKKFLLRCCCKMGCWFLCQSGWWCSCQFGYIPFSISSFWFLYSCFLLTLLFSSLVEIWWHMFRLCRNAGCNSCPSQIKAQSVHWVYEIWTCSFPKVILKLQYWLLLPFGISLLAEVQ